MASLLLLLPLVVVCSTTCENKPCSPREGISQIRDKIISALDDYDDYDSFAEITEKDVRNAVEEAKREAKTNYGVRWDNDVAVREPVLTHSSMMAAKSEAMQISATSNVLLEATKILRARFGPDALYQLQYFDANRFVQFQANDCLENSKCDEFAPYRTFSGWCNNLGHAQFGSAFQPLRHLLPPQHENELDSPRSLSKSGHPLPSPRVVSNVLHHDTPVDSRKVSLMLMQFGQFIDHEITHSPVERGAGGSNLNCSRCDSASTISSSCLPIKVPLDDSHFQSESRRCLPFVRSISGQREFGARNQMNQITSFIDGSVIYGSTKCESEKVRSFEGGMLKSTAGGSHLGMLLPPSTSSDCRSAPTSPCFTAGDERNSQHTALNSLQTVFLRHHNQLARRLGRRNRHWNDEKIFQETRRIVGAQLAHIFYSEFLPKVIGMTNMDAHELKPQQHGFYKGHDASCNAAISQPFATAAFRFGHSLVKRFFPRLKPNYQNNTAPVDLEDSFNNMEAIYDSRNGGVDSILMGLIGSPSAAFDRHVSTAVRNHLFARPGNPGSGLDLISINIQRGRDHAVSGYNAHRAYCGSQRATSFFELASDMEMSSIEALQSVYEHVDDIDLFSGLTSERPTHDGLVGPTTACILAEQFKRLKKCDRFFYENDSPVGFSPDQLREIRRTTFSSILCSTGRLQLVQPDVFLLPDEFMNTPAPCDTYPTINLDYWIED